MFGPSGERGDARRQLHQNHASAHARTVFFTMEAGGGASLRRADAAQVCNNVGFGADDGKFECSFAIAAREIVSERW